MDISQPTVDRVVERLIARYSSDTHVIGMFLIGSAATGTMDQRSDIDIIVVTKAPAPHSREEFTDESGLPVEVLFNTTDELSSYMKKEAGSLYRNVSTMLGDAKILHDPAEALTGYLTTAAETLASKTTLSAADKLMHRYSLTDFLSDAEREAEAGNTLAAALVADLLIRNAIDAILALSGSYYLPPRRLAARLRVLDPEFTDKLEAYHVAAAPERHAALASLAGVALARLGGPLPKSWKL